ncbi:unnamed protein product [Ambrosiozyma monospora]|uniref:Calcium-binding protein NCS-1 n=1 Tax=Ambrosiozyma monospora TaxID=43982 RepID=A0A9W6YR65_AMBMO|nr:unnamed protein product [Ambrosiozyma monospora]
MGQKTSKLNKEDLTKLRAETGFTTRELQQWYKGFRRDVPTGQLTKEDFLKIHKQFYPFGDPTDFSNLTFHAFDVNDVGYIDFKSFILSLNTASHGTTEQKLRWSFKVYDRDGDGQVSYADLLKVIKSIYKMIGFSTAKFDEDEITPEMRADKVWLALGKDLTRKESDLITLTEFTNVKNLDKETLDAMNVYNDLI